MMFGRRSHEANTAEIKRRLDVMKRSYHAEVDRVQELSEENERLRSLVGKKRRVKRCPSRPGDNRQSCGTCGLVQHRSDASKNEPCRRCHAGVEPGENFLDMPASKIPGKIKDGWPVILTMCPSCHGVQRWARKQCRRCYCSVEAFHSKMEPTRSVYLGHDEVIVDCDFIHKAQENEREVKRLDECATKLSRGNKSLRGVMERRDEKIKTLERQLNFSKSTKSDTFMGMPIADAVSAVFVADELARAVTSHAKWANITEIANRLLKLRDPPPVPKRVKLVCTKCGGVITGDNLNIATAFCPKQDCTWEGES